MSRTLPALSIRQPWAWLIVHGFKDVENRDWPTNFRGRLLVHAGLTLTRPYYDEQASAMARAGLMPAGFPSFEELRAQTVGIVGECRVVDCLAPDARPADGGSPWWLEGAHAFVLRDPRPLPLYPVKGRLGFFDVKVAA